MQIVGQNRHQQNPTYDAKRSECLTGHRRVAPIEILRISKAFFIPRGAALRFIATGPCLPWPFLVGRSASTLVACLRPGGFAGTKFELIINAQTPIMLIHATAAFQIRGCEPDGPIASEHQQCGQVA
jgi:hypothetical protein